MNTIAIIYQDEHLLVVDKPANLLTVPGKGPDKQDCLINRLLNDYPDARIVHRLDMATSGLVIIALSHRAQAAMGKLFEHKTIKKQYIAVVSGHLEQKNGVINMPLICDWENRPKQKIDHEHGKSAQTHFELLGYEGNDSRVLLRPLTGRSHQLRVHMQSLGHPIIGDYFYAPEPIKSQSSRLLLHAHTLQFTHPITQQPMDICSETPF